MPSRQPPFYVVPAPAIRAVLSNARREVADIVRRAYELYAAGRAIDPNSHFLRFPDRPGARIIALPAYVEGKVERAGVKWISSFPENLKRGLLRASGVLVLNDHETGYPIACLEASLISAARTAASAALAAHALTPWVDRKLRTVAVVGAGVIARSTLEWLCALGWHIEQLLVADLEPERAERFADRLRGSLVVDARAASLEEALRTAELSILATTAPEPHITENDWFAHGPTVLHLSLRDIAVPIVLAAQNIVDDVDHCLKASTSLHLAEQSVGGRAFVGGTLVDVTSARVAPDRTRLRLFSPFGMGILDVAVGAFVLERCIEAQTAIAVNPFFPDPES